MPRRISDGDFSDLKDKIYLINATTARIEQHLQDLNGQIVNIKQGEKDCKADFNKRFTKNEERINDLYVKLALIVGGGGTVGGVIGVFIGKILGF